MPLTMDLKLKENDLFLNGSPAANTSFASVGVQTWGFVLLFKFSTGRQFSASKSATSLGPKTLAAIFDHHKKKINSNMKCPHCLVEFHDEKVITPVASDIDGDWAIETYSCPSPKCKKAILYLINAEIYQNRDIWKWVIDKNAAGEEQLKRRDLIKPKGSSRPPVPIEVPKEIADDYTEACVVLSDSTKASAALSRRCLQHLLRQSAGIKKGDLANEIQQVLDSNKLPTHLAESIDAIRNFGNFAAHPLQNTSTGEIVEVEPGEADWTLEVLEMLFDFYYVQPERTKQRRAALNSKLNDTGKPNMK